MIRRMIGAAIGARVAKTHPALGGAAGAMLASAVPFVISRVSLPAMVVLGVGGYVAKRYMDAKGDKNAAEQATKPTPPPAPVQQ
jgi:hypothetical protein